ncbi:MAG: hypothetical protein KDA72_15465 [Planctomycetales bacterium]|nr:hypothetical protein [Planctomycetales bacterium]
MSGFGASHRRIAWTFSLEIPVASAIPLSQVIGEKVALRDCPVTHSIPQPATQRNS